MLDSLSLVLLTYARHIDKCNVTYIIVTYAYVTVLLSILFNQSTFLSYITFGESPKVNFQNS